MLILALLGGSQAAVYSDSWLSTLFPTTVFLAYLAIHGENITVSRKFLLQSQTKREKHGEQQRTLARLGRICSWFGCGGEGAELSTGSGY